MTVKVINDHTSAVVEYDLTDKDQKNLDKAKKYFEDNPEAFSICYHFYGLQSVIEDDEEWRVDGDYLKVYSTGRLYIQVWEKYTGRVMEVCINDSIERDSII